VSACGTVRYAVFHFNMCQVIHQLHRAVLDCGIESYIEKVTRPVFSCVTSLSLPPLHLTRPTAVSALLRRLRRLQRHRSWGYVRIQSTHIRSFSRAAFSFAASSHFTADTVVVTAISHGLDKLLLPPPSHFCAIQT
jgi:hypothetical protein